MGLGPWIRAALPESYTPDLQKKLKEALCEGDYKGEKEVKKRGRTEELQGTELCTQCTVMGHRYAHSSPRAEPACGPPPRWTPVPDVRQRSSFPVAAWSSGVLR